MRPEELRTIRRRLGLSQNALAARLDLRQSTVSRWEAGLMPIERPAMLRLALAGLMAHHDGGPPAGRPSDPN